MNGFKACLYKDICLLGPQTALLGIILTVLLALFSAFGMNDAMDKAVTVQPFALGVIDEDDSVFSRAFLTQLRAVPVFSRIRIKKAGDDEPLTNKSLKAGDFFKKEEFGDCAAIIVIPRDYFYSLYEMRGEPSLVILNENMPLEARLTLGMISSAAETVCAEREAWYSAYMLYTDGKPNEAEYYDFLDKASTQMFKSVIDRKAVFDKEEAQYIDAGKQIVTAFAACACGMLILFICTGVLKTLPEEACSGVFDRFKALGGKTVSVLLSKLVTAAVFTIPGIITVMLVLKVPLSFYNIILIIFAMFAAFGIVFMISTLCENAQQLMLTGSIATIVSQLFGGVIYPVGLMSETLKPLRLFCIPYHIMQGLREPNAESLIWLISMGLITSLAAVFIGSKCFPMKGAVKK